MPATGVTISGFTISGPANGIGYGVLVDQNGVATVTGNKITAIHDAPDVTGNQNGVGIAAGCCLPTPGASSGSVTATNNTIDTYQKAGIDIRGDGSSGTLSGNNITGRADGGHRSERDSDLARRESDGDREHRGRQRVPAADRDRNRNSHYRRTTAPPVGNVTVSNNTLRRNDGNIFVFGVKSGSVITVTGNTTTAGLYGIIVDDSTKVLVEKNIIGAPGIDGIDAGPDAAGNTFRANKANGAIEPGHDCLDESTGGLTAGTNNTWTGNAGDIQSPVGICSGLAVDLPPVIVLPPKGTGPAVPAGPPGQEVGNKVITKMRKNQLSSCVIEVRALGPSRALVARGVAHAPATGTGRLVVRINIKPKGRVLLSKHFGGLVGNVRALCRSTDGKLHRVVKRVRVVLLVEHRLTPPGAWVPDQPILTGIGHTFMRHLVRRMFKVRAIQCDGFTATWPPSPAHPPTLSLNRAKRVCGQLKRFGPTKARVRLVPHGKNDPIASNSTEAGRRVNRRVFVTIVHVFVFRS